MKKILRSIVAMSLALALVGCSGAGGAAKTSGTASKGAESAKTDLPVLRVDDAFYYKFTCTLHSGK